MRSKLRRKLTIDVNTEIASPMTTPSATPVGTPVNYLRSTPTSTPGGSPASTPRSPTESAVSAAAKKSAGSTVHTERDDFLSDEDKRELVLQEPKFGMFSMTKQFLRAQNRTVYLFLPLLVFTGQWTMFVAVITHNLKVPPSTCSGGAPETKLLFISVCLVYFAQSVLELDDLWRRRGAKRVKTTPEASYTIMLDRLHEHAFTLMVQVRGE